MSDFNDKPIPFPTVQDAIEYASEFLSDVSLSIVKSRHPNNKNGDYFITEPATIVRSWETLVFEGKGKDAK